MFDHFEKVCVINLPERTDRLRDTLDELRKAGCSGQADIFAAIRPADAGGFGSIGEHGCYLSHLAVLERYRSSSSLLVLEDDVAFALGRAELDHAVAALPDDWEVFYGGWSQLTSGNHWPKQGIVEAGPTSEFIGTHCYALRGSSIDTLLDRYRLFMTRERGHPDGGRISIDGAMNIARRQLGLRTYISVPPLAVQRSSRSDIADPKWFDRTTALRPALGFARQIKNVLRRRAAP